MVECCVRFKAALPTALTVFAVAARFLRFFQADCAESAVMTNVMTILACAWALLRYRPLQIARGLLPWLFLTSILWLGGATLGFRGLANILLFLGIAFCMALFASTYAAMAYPAHARPASIIEELKVAGVALVKTLAVAIVLALLTGLIKTAVGADPWDLALAFSMAAITLCLTFFVVNNHVGEGMAFQRLVAIVAAMPLTTLAIVVAAMAWNFGIDLVQDQIRPWRKDIMADELMPFWLKMALVGLYMTVFSYLRMAGTAALFVALHAFWSNRHQPPSGVRPPERTLLVRRG
jgi:hypothetical protein